MPPLSTIHLRDPFVVPVPEEGRYYLYGTTRAAWTAEGAMGFDAYTSRDLEQWEGPYEVFSPPPGFWGDRNFWAPEVHRYQGRYYLFGSFKAESVCRGTGVLVADTPLGPFQPWSDGPLTPRDWECLDGTLYVDEAGAPWLVYCHEWAQVEDGEMIAQRLSDTLERTVGEPQLLFRASAVPWVVSVRPKPGQFVTDGPCLYRAGNGELLMLWSSFGSFGYGVTVARSTSGGILGPWVQEPQPLFTDDGGHGSCFRDLEGRLWLELHQPNKTPQERGRLLLLREENGYLSIA